VRIFKKHEEFKAYFSSAPVLTLGDVDADEEHPSYFLTVTQLTGSEATSDVWNSTRAVPRNRISAQITRNEERCPMLSVFQGHNGTCIWTKQMVPIPVSDALFLKDHDFNVANGNLDAYLMILNVYSDLWDMGILSPSSSNPGGMLRALPAAKDAPCRKVAAGIFGGRMSGTKLGPSLAVWSLSTLPAIPGQVIWEVVDL